MKRRLIFVVLALLSLGAWAVARETRTPDSESWVRVERRDLVIGVEVEGELEAAESAELGPPSIRSFWDFKLSFLAPEGAEVEADARLMAFDSTQLEQRLQEKVAERDSAQKELEKRVDDLEIERRNMEMTLEEARARLRRAELKLAVPEEVALRNELEIARLDESLARREIAYLETKLEHRSQQSEAELATLREQRDRADGRVRELESEIARMTVHAPRAGTVIYRRDRRGEKKQVGDSVWREEKVLEIPDLAHMLGEGQVAEADVGRLAAGQRVVLRLDAYPEEEHTGKVLRIRRTVQQKSWRDPRKMVLLTVELDHTDPRRMRPGMRFRGTIETERAADSLVVPHAAVFSRPRGPAAYVRTLLGRREVFPDFGRRNEEYLEVVSGLAEGDRVLRRGSGGGAP